MLTKTCDQSVDAGLEVVIDNWNDWGQFVHEFNTINPNQEPNHYTIWKANEPVPIGFTLLELVVEPGLLLDVDTLNEFTDFRLTYLSMKGITQWRIYFDYFNPPRIEDGIIQVAAIPVITATGGGGGGQPPGTDVIIDNWQDWGDFVHNFDPANPNPELNHYTIWKENESVPIDYEKLYLAVEPGLLLDVNTQGKFITFKDMYIQAKGIIPWHHLYFDYVRSQQIEYGIEQLKAIPVITSYGGGGGQPPGTDVIIDNWQDWGDFVHEFDQANPNPEPNHYTVWKENEPVPIDYEKLYLVVDAPLLIAINTQPKFITLKYMYMQPKGILVQDFFEWINYPPYREDGMRQFKAIPVITSGGGGPGPPPEPMHEVKIYDFTQWNDFVFPYSSNPSMEIYHHTLWSVNTNAPTGFKKKGIEFDADLLNIVKSNSQWMQFHLMLRNRGLDDYQQYFEHHGLTTTQLKPIPAVAVEYTGELPLAPPEISQFDLIINAKDVNTGEPIVGPGSAFDPREESASFAWNVNKPCTGYFRIYRGVPGSVFTTKIVESPFGIEGIEGGSINIPWRGQGLPLRTYWYEVVVTNRGGNSKVEGQIRLIKKKYKWLDELPPVIPEAGPPVYEAGIFSKLGELAKKYWYVPVGMTAVTVGLLRFRKTRHLVLGRRR